jgi:hypothetical protein
VGGADDVGSAGADGAGAGTGGADGSGGADGAGAGTGGADGSGGADGDSLITLSLTGNQIPSLLNVTIPLLAGATIYWHGYPDGDARTEAAADDERTTGSASTADEKRLVETLALFTAEHAGPLSGSVDITVGRLDFAARLAKGGEARSLSLFADFTVADETVRLSVEVDFQ